MFLILQNNTKLGENFKHRYQNISIIICPDAFVDFVFKTKQQQQQKRSNYFKYVIAIILFIYFGSIKNYI